MCGSGSEVGLFGGSVLEETIHDRGERHKQGPSTPFGLSTACWTAPAIPLVNGESSSLVGN